MTRKQREQIRDDALKLREAAELLLVACCWYSHEDKMEVVRRLDRMRGFRGKKVAT